ncbi:hypothetical protein WMF37_52450 [Sorangium sp. So ce291]|uniref:hypothetical protein n=1 Tax=Sorangium sp. So ce291 TaxID=3133294 RepID=UPI003F61D5A4
MHEPPPAPPVLPLVDVASLVDVAALVDVVSPAPAAPLPVPAPPLPPEFDALLEGSPLHDIDAKAAT